MGGGGAPQSASGGRPSRRSRGRKAHCGTRASCGHWLLDRLRIFVGQLRRPATEVQSIFLVAARFLRLERVRLRQAGVRLEVIGRRDRIPNCCCARSTRQSLRPQVARNFYFALLSITLHATPLWTLPLAYLAAFCMSDYPDLPCFATCLLRSWPRGAAK